MEQEIQGQASIDEVRNVFTSTSGLEAIGGRYSLTINDDQLIKSEENKAQSLFETKPCIKKRLIELEKNVSLILDDHDYLKQSNATRDEKINEINVTLEGLNDTLTKLKRNLTRIYGKRI